LADRDADLAVLTTQLTALSTSSAVSDKDNGQAEAEAAMALQRERNDHTANLAAPLAAAAAEADSRLQQAQAALDTDLARAHARSAALEADVKVFGFWLGCFSLGLCINSEASRRFSKRSAPIFCSASTARRHLHQITRFAIFKQKICVAMSFVCRPVVSCSIRNVPYPDSTGRRA
jgi:hypothetical protein